MEDRFWRKPELKIITVLLVVCVCKSAAKNYVYACEFLFNLCLICFFLFVSVYLRCYSLRAQCRCRHSIPIDLQGEIAYIITIIIY